MIPPSFICVQDLDATGYDCIKALRFHLVKSAELGRQLTLAFDDEPVNVRQRSELPANVAVDIMLEFGTYFEEADHPCNVNRAANDIARVTRRGAGNTIIMHEDDTEEFYKFFENAMHLNYTLHSVRHPGLLGKLIVSYKGPTSQQCDGAPIMAHKGDKYGFSLVGIQDYVRILGFKRNQSTSALRRARKVQHDKNHRG